MLKSQNITEKAIGRLVNQKHMQTEHQNHG